jgi:hypothetical protein
MPTPTVNVTTPAPAYDAVGAGNSAGSVSSLTWNHTAAAGATVTAVISTNDSGSPSVKYGSSTMTKLTPSSAADASGYTTYFYKLSGAPGGTQTVTVTPSAAADVAGNTISATSVTSVGTPAAASGAAASASQAVTCTSSQLIIQSFAELGSGGGVGTTISATGGGTRRSLLALFGANCFSISTATATTTFTATFSATASWVGLAVILS